MFDVSSYQFNPYCIPPGIVSVILLIIGIIIFLYNRKSAINISFFILSVTFYIWLSGMALIYLCKTADVALSWYKYYVFFGVSFIGPNVYCFVRSVNQTLIYSKKKILALYSAALFFYIAALKTDFIITGMTRYFWGWSPIYSPISYIFVVYLVLVMAKALSHLWMEQKELLSEVQKRKVRILCYGFLFSQIAILDFLPKYGIGLYPFGYLPLAVWGLFMSYNLIKYKFMIITPEIAADEIIALIPDFLILIDPNEKIIRINEAVEKVLGYKKEELVGKQIGNIVKEKKSIRKIIETLKKEKLVKNTEVTYLSKSGMGLPVLFSGIVIEDMGSNIKGIVCVAQDITKLKTAQNNLEKAYFKLKNTQVQLVQAEKMAGIGQLAAGIVHEINNPTAFVRTNLVVMKEKSRELRNILSSCEKFLTSVIAEDKENYEELMEQLNDISVRADLKYINNDVPELIDETIEGTERIEYIVSNLKSFAYPSKGRPVYSDINQAIDKAVAIVINELKYKCVIIKDLGDLDHIKLHQTDIIQVFVNILINAGQAIIGKGEIIIKSYMKGRYVYIEITDNGKGIPEENIRDIFNPFFTNKEIGKGAGLGLAIVYAIIKRHKGNIEVKSEVDKGTTFIIRLPV